MITYLLETRYKQKKSKNKLSIQNVTDWLRAVPELEECANTFLKRKVDGRGLFGLTKESSKELGVSDAGWPIIEEMVGHLKEKEEKMNEDLGELLIEFCELYGIRQNWHPDWPKMKSVLNVGVQPFPVEINFGGVRLLEAFTDALKTVYHTLKAPLGDHSSFLSKIIFPFARSVSPHPNSRNMRANSRQFQGGYGSPYGGYAQSSPNSVRRYQSYSSPSSNYSSPSSNYRSPRRYMPQSPSYASPSAMYPMYGYRSPIPQRSYHSPMRSPIYSKNRQKKSAS